MSYASGNNLLVLQFLCSLCSCAVNIFVLISGYFLISTTKRTIDKPLSLIIQTVLFSILFYLFSYVLGKTPLTVNAIINTIIPHNYFVTLYVVLYLLSPYINSLISIMNQSQCKRLIIFLLMIFSFYSTLIEIVREIFGLELAGASPVGLWGSQYGYTIINFSMLYLIGGYIGKYGININFNKLKLIFIFFVSIIVVYIWRILEYQMIHPTQPSSTSYNNPFVICNAVCLFLIFKELKFNNKIINNLAKSVFTCFLIHHYFFHFFRIEEFVSRSTYCMMLHLFATVSCIYIISWGVWKVYDIFFNSLIKKYLNKEIIY